MKRKKFKFFVILILSTMFVTACSSKKELKDGVFEGYYKDESATVKVVITIKDKKIVDCVREKMKTMAKMMLILTINKLKKL